MASIIPTERKTASSSQKTIAKKIMKRTTKEYQLQLKIDKEISYKTKTTTTTKRRLKEQKGD